MSNNTVSACVCGTSHGREISSIGEDILYSELLQGVLQVDLLLHFEPE